MQRLFEGVELSPRLQAEAKDAKTALQEWLQGRRLKLPLYRVVQTTGAAHSQVFHVECEVAEKGLLATGQESRGVPPSRLRPASCWRSCQPGIEHEYS